MVSQLPRGGTAGIRDRDHYIDIVVRPLLQHALGQILAHTQARFVHGNTVDDGIGTREIDVLEDAWRVERIFRALTCVEIACHVDEDGLTRLHVTHAFKAKGVDGDTLGSNDILISLGGTAFADHQRADAVGIAESNDAVANDQRNHRVSSLDTLVHTGYCIEHIVLIDTILALALQFVGKDIEQDFRVGAGIDVTQVLTEQVLHQGLGVGQIAVMSQGNTVGRIDIKRLRLGRGGATRSGIAHMADTHISLQAQHMAGMKHVAHQTVVLSQVQPVVVTGHDAGSILATMLQYGQTVIDHLIDGTFTYDADNAAHAFNSPHKPKIADPKHC